MGPYRGDGREQDRLERLSEVAEAARAFVNALDRNPGWPAMRKAALEKALGRLDELGTPFSDRAAGPGGS